jgi:hypothetical protein
MGIAILSLLWFFSLSVAFVGGCWWAGVPR